MDRESKRRFSVNENVASQVGFSRLEMAYIQALAAGLRTNRKIIKELGWPSTNKAYRKGASVRDKLRQREIAVEVTDRKVDHYAIRDALLAAGVIALMAERIRNSGVSRIQKFEHYRHLMYPRPKE